MSKAAPEILLPGEMRQEVKTDEEGWDSYSD